jgi:putative aldouronate transport system permease protein
MEVKFLNQTASSNKHSTVSINPKSNFRNMMNKIWKDKSIYLILLPGIIYFVVFHYFPMYGAIIAFKDFRVTAGIFGSKWVGLKNFIDFFHHPSFRVVLTNTLLISLYKIMFGFPAPIILALLLNEVKQEVYKRYIQTISYLPHFLSWVVIAGLAAKMFSPSSGVVNGFIKSLGFQPIYFMAEPRYFRTILVLTDIWKEIGWGSIIYLAALSGVDPQLYEAATVDGASKWKQLWNITIPSIAPTIVIMFILRVGGVMNAGFEQVYMMYSPNVYAVSDIIDTFVYRSGLESAKYSFATAIGLFKSVIGFSLILITNRLSKLIDENNGLW